METDEAFGAYTDMFVSNPQSLAADDFGGASRGLEAR
jgi:hypothetical protein